ncbi:MAG: DUF6526 family protein [Acidobacteriota bacterium]|nr:DUF6526 family protein [Acidobacteriota bacterium]
MPESKPQSRSNHVRFDPVFHFFLLPALLLLLVWVVVRLVRYPGSDTAIPVAMVVLMTVIAFKSRIYALKVQDRVIRLEERLRLKRVMPERLHSRIPELSEAQLIALRFASDAEVPTLAERASAEKLGSKQIKDAIRTWRPDHWRV